MNIMILLKKSQGEFTLGLISLLSSRPVLETGVKLPRGEISPLQTCGYTYSVLLRDRGELTPGKIPPRGKIMRVTEV